MAEKLSVSKETPKIHLPRKELVGVEPSKKQQDLTSESAKLPTPTQLLILVVKSKNNLQKKQYSLLTLS